MRSVNTISIFTWLLQANLEMLFEIAAVTGFELGSDLFFFSQNMLPTTTPQDAQQWLHRNRFSQFCRLFTNFSGKIAP